MTLRVCVLVLALTMLVLGVVRLARDWRLPVVDFVPAVAPHNDPKPRPSAPLPAPPPAAPGPLAEVPVLPQSEPTTEAKIPPSDPPASASHAVALTDSAALTDTLRRALGNADVIILSSAAPGSAEDLTARAALSEALASIGSRTLVLDAPAVEARALNSAPSATELASALRQFHSARWRAAPVSAAIQSLRSKHNLRIEAVDPVNPALARRAVIEYLAEADPAFAQHVRRVYDDCRQSENPPIDRGIAEIELSPAVAAGKAVTISGWILSDAPPPAAAELWIESSDDSGMTASAAQCARPGAWQHVSATVTIPPTSRDIRLGVRLVSAGVAWFDALQISIDGVPVNARDLDLSFESESALGVNGLPTSHRLALDRATFLDGAQSLRIERQPSGDPGAASEAARAVVDELLSRRSSLPPMSGGHDLDFALRCAELAAQRSEIEADPARAPDAWASNIASLVPPRDSPAGEAVGLESRSPLIVWLDAARASEVERALLERHALGVATISLEASGGATLTDDPAYPSRPRVVSLPESSELPPAMPALERVDGSWRVRLGRVTPLEH